MLMSSDEHTLATFTAPGPAPMGVLDQPCNGHDEKSDEGTHHKVELILYLVFGSQQCLHVIDHRRRPSRIWLVSAARALRVVFSELCYLYLRDEVHLKSITDCPLGKATKSEFCTLILSAVWLVRVLRIGVG